MHGHTRVHTCMHAHVWAEVREQPGNPYVANAPWVISVLLPALEPWAPPLCVWHCPETRPCSRASGVLSMLSCFPPEGQRSSEIKWCLSVPCSVPPFYKGDSEAQRQCISCEGPWTRGTLPRCHVCALSPWDPSLHLQEPRGGEIW